MEKKLAQFWQSKAKCGLCIKKFECLTRIVVAPQWQVWSRPKQLLVGQKSRPQHLATDKGVILCAPLRSGYEGLFVKIRTRERQTLP